MSYKSHGITTQSASCVRIIPYAVPAGRLDRATMSCCGGQKLARFAERKVVVNSAQIPDKIVIIHACTSCGNQLRTHTSQPIGYEEV